MTHQAPIHPAASASDADLNSPTEARSGERWTPPKMAAFLRTLAATHSVSAAARSVGMSRQSAYRLRARVKGEPFDLAWDEAFTHSYQNLPYAALDRALNGIEVPHYYKGELIGTSRRFDERLTVALLKLSGPSDTLGAGGDRAAAARQRERFAALLADVELDGEAAASDDFRANPTDLSPTSNAAEMAELRGFRGGR